MAETIKCKRCGQQRPALGYAPVPTELGQKIGTEICQPCWSEWLGKQTMLINHYGLDVSNPETHDFLFDNMKTFFYGEEGNLATIDTTKQGSVKW
ncbi:MAG: oxidative damage protection protein [Pyrinomonadaceae bacterium]